MHYLPLAPGFFAILVGFFFIVLILRSGRCQALIYWFNKRRIVIRRPANAARDRWRQVQAIRDPFLRSATAQMTFSLT